MKILRRKVPCSSCSDATNHSASKLSRSTDITAALGLSGGDSNSVDTYSYAKLLGNETALRLEEQGYTASYEARGRALNILIHTDSTGQGNITFTLPFIAITPDDDDIESDAEMLVESIQKMLPDLHGDETVDLEKEFEEISEPETTDESSEDFKYDQSPTL